ncbi:Uncharacterized protein FWK35_00034062, partial [Aphis craccivora]
TAVNDDTITQNNIIEVTLDNVPNPIDVTCIDIPSTSRLVNKTRKRIHEPLRQSTLNYLEEKHQREQATLNKQLIIEENRLEIENKRLKLDTEKFEFEKKQKSELLELEITERKERLRLEVREKEERLNFENKEREERLKLKVEKLKIASQQQTLLQLMLEQLNKK